MKQCIAIRWLRCQLLRIVHSQCDGRLWAAECVVIRDTLLNMDTTAKLNGFDVVMFDGW